MLFAFSRGSSGEGSERYSLRIPLVVADDEQFKFDADNAYSVGDRILRVAKSPSGYFLSVESFESAEDARVFLSKLHGALLRLTLQRRLGLHVETALQDIRWIPSKGHLKDNPNLKFLYEQFGWTAIDGWIDTTPSVVIPEHKRLVQINEGTFTATRGFSFEQLAKLLGESLETSSPENLSGDERLALAIDLFASSRHETTRRGRLVTLVTALEALLDASAVSEASSILIDELLEHAQAFQGARPEREHPQLDRLRSRLGNLKRDSIKQSFRDFGAREADQLGGDPEDFAARLASAYDVRSALLHTGSADEAQIAEALEWLSEWVPKLLEQVADRTAAAF